MTAETLSPGRGRAGQVGEDPDDVRPEIGIGEATAQVVVSGLGRVLVLVFQCLRVGWNSDELGEGALVGGGYLDALAVRCGHLRPRHAGDHHVAVGDIDPLRTDRNEKRIERGVLGFLRCQPRTMPPLGGMARMTSQGTVAVIDTGLSEISGEVTLSSRPLRPVQRGGGLHDRQQWGQHRHHEAQQARHDGHPPGDRDLPVSRDVRGRLAHSRRCHRAVLFMGGP